MIQKLETRMLFMLKSQARAGVTRQQIAEHFSGKLDPSTWNLIRHGVVSNVLFKTGDDVGFYALLSAATAEEARLVIEQHTAHEELFDVKIVPVNQFPHFD